MALQNIKRVKLEAAGLFKAKPQSLYSIFSAFSLKSQASPDSGGEQVGSAS